MSDSRDGKRGKFVENKKSGLNIKPKYILGLVAVVVGIVVAATLLMAVSGDSGASAGNEGLAFEKPAANATSTVDSGTGVSNANEGNAGNAVATQPPLPTLNVANFEIEGMTCGGCSNGIMRGLDDAEGVSRCSVSWRDKEGIVEYDPAVTNPQEIAEFITGMGFATTVAE